MSNEQRVGQATISAYACSVCMDTGIQAGTAELDGELVVVMRVCKFCNKAGKPPVNKDEVIYD